MLDPVPPPAPWLYSAVEPLANKLGLYALPAHVHEVIFAFTIYHLIYTVGSPVLSNALVPDTYRKLNARQKINWDVHVVSFIQSVFINILALYVINTDPERKGMNALERIYGYTGACGLVGALGAGYFLWDTIISTRYLNLFGIGTLLHALAALCVFSAGSRPYLQYYGSTFILYELSTPFLNIHWFCDKLGLTGSKLQWYNGMCLLATFAGCRLFWGTYQSFRVYQDIWEALSVPSTTSIASAIQAHALESGTSERIFKLSGGQCVLGDPSCAAAQSEILRFISHSQHLPVGLAFSTIASNLVLNSLNFFWYTKMIKTVLARFKGVPDRYADQQGVLVEGVTLAADDLDEKVPEGYGKITDSGKDSETPGTQSEDMVKGVSSAVGDKVDGVRERK
ncbi:hypothetical protein UCRPC4_g05028 [Phaeomoniella chlamydospora]|uniref:TLC domain-containing protein n=1 Tax=Phaeomoniella chlamydospora TaxID=158046 RepID=A0A0G2E7Q7_PHACM|nr:hypothetical protein UCRPC4_g05028 [Phaeomoniella chlamydospora]